MIQHVINNKKVWRLFCVLFGVCFAMLPLAAWAATNYFLPQAQTIYQDESFIISLMIDTENEEINAVAAYLNFPQDKLEVVDIGKGGSILSLWPKEPSYSNQSGEIGFSGGIPNGFKGQGKLISITFRVLPNVVQGTAASISFKDSSQVLLNDGLGTPAELSFQEGNYKIIERPEGLPIISSKTHPDQNKWYQGTTLHLHWDLIEGAEYSYLLSYDPAEEPDKTPDTPEGELMWLGDMEYKGLEDGIYYFHLREKRGTDAEPYAEQRGKWGPKVTFRAMIDATPPEDFQPQITEIEGKKYLVFATIDKTSGVDYYQVSEADGRGFIRRLIQKDIKEEWKKAESPYLLEDQILRSRILLRAVDKAGNERRAEILPPFRIIWEDIIILFLILIVIGVILWTIRRIITKQKRNL